MCNFVSDKKIFYLINDISAQTIVRSFFPHFFPFRAFSLFFNAETNQPVNGSMLESECRQQPSLSFIPTQLHPYSPFNRPVNKIQATKPAFHRHSFNGKLR